MCNDRRPSIAKSTFEELVSSDLIIREIAYDSKLTDRMISRYTVLCYHWPNRNLRVWKEIYSYLMPYFSLTNASTFISSRSSDSNSHSSHFHFHLNDEFSAFSKWLLKSRQKELRSTKYFNFNNKLFNIWMLYDFFFLSPFLKRFKKKNRFYSKTESNIEESLPNKDTNPNALIPFFSSFFKVRYHLF